MSRPPRIHIPGAYHHVTLRGNHRQAIFQTAQDREDLNDIVDESTHRYGVEIHAYCWMTNHIHLLTRVDEAPLGRVIHAIASRYAKRYQRVIPTTGHLFERRYHASLVATDGYLLQVIRYIHLNPVVAGLAACADEYPWSSHHGYLGVDSPRWLTTRLVMSMFDEDPRAARVRYVEFIRSSEAEVCAGITPERADAEVASTSDFSVEPRRGAGNAELEALITAMCSDARMPVSALDLRSKNQDLLNLRAEIAIEALRRGIANLSEVAARMHRHPSNLTRLLQARNRR